jgi:hypothetical protein
LAMMAISRWPIFASVADRTENISVSCYDPVGKHSISFSAIDQTSASAHAIVALVLCQNAWYTCSSHRTDFYGKYHG